MLDVVHNVQPTVLIGVSGPAGAFSEPIVCAMAERNKRPVILPLSNPTPREEATTADIEAWTEGWALIGVGSPFPPIMRDGSLKVDQTNNSRIFPVSASVTIAVWLCPARPRSIVHSAWIRTTSTPIASLRGAAVFIGQPVTRESRMRSCASHDEAVRLVCCRVLYRNAREPAVGWLLRLFQPC